MSWHEVSKSRAFLSHLGISATIVGAVILLVFLVWYPEPFFEAVGTWSVVRILVGVDLVLGPLLTLIVFRPRKPNLLLDMTVIATVQAVALIYGVSVLYRERPYYVVFAVDRFHVLAHEDIVAAAPDWISKPIVGPEKVVAKLPEDSEARNRLIDETVFGGAPDIELRPEFWTRYASETESIVARAAPITTLREAGASVSKEVDAILRALDVSEDALGFLPIISKKLDGAAIIDKSTAEIVAVIAVDPWPLLHKTV